MSAAAYDHHRRRRIETDARVTTVTGDLAGRVLDVEVEWGRIAVTVAWDDGEPRPKNRPQELIVIDTERNW